jgi:hypothetical protein
MSGKLCKNKYCFSNKLFMSTASLLVFKLGTIMNIFQWRISFRPFHGPGVDSAPSENEYQEHSWG